MQRDEHRSLLISNKLFGSGLQEWSHGLDLRPGVVTYMSRVEAFATRIKIESSDQSPFRGRSRDQGGLQVAKINGSRTRGCNLTFDPEKSSDQEPQKGTIKRSSALFPDQTF